MVLPGKQGIFLSIFIFFILGGIFTLSAAGMREDPLVEAGRLIEEKRYNEAINIITEVLKTDPKRLEEGEALLKEIREARSLYNQVFAQLLEMLQQEDIDEDAAYELLQQLKSIDQDPNKASSKAVLEATAGIVFKVNDREFRRIMAEAEEKIASELYWEAVEIYLTGFNLHREQFETDEYGNIVENRIDSIINAAKNQAAEFINEEDQLLTEAGDTLEAELDTPQEFLARIKNLSGTMIDVLKIRNAIIGYAESIEEQRQILLEDEGDDIPFLSTLRILIKGRETSDKDEGIAGAVNAFWNVTASEAVSKSSTYSSQKFSAGLEALNEMNWDQALRDFSDTEVYALALIESGSLKFAGEESRFEDQLNSDLLTNLEPMLPSVLNGRIFAEAARGYIRGIGIYRGSETVVQDLAGISSEDDLTGIRTDFSERISIISQELDMWKDTQVSYDRLRELGIYIDEGLERIAGISGVLNELDLSLKNGDAEIVHRGNQIFFAPLNENIQTQNALIEEGRGLQEGVGVEGSDYVQYYPKESIEVLTPVRSRLSSISAVLLERQQQLASEPEYIREYTEIVNDFAYIQSAVETLETYHQEVETLLSRADLEVQLSERYKANGYAVIEDAERSLRNDEFKDALAKVDEANTAFAESLKHQEDPDFRTQADELTRELAERITKEWQNLVVRQVRTFLNEAEAFYQREEFGKAQTVLLKADDLWSDANAEENEEISSWLIRIENALKATTGRIIQATNPLYTEMSNLLNLAQQDFLKAKTMLAAGDKETAQELFAGAEEKISYVKDPFPINQEAGVLLLKIDQLRDPENFLAVFKTKFDTAVSKLGTEDEAIGYSLLKELQEINPRYPGIDSAIYRFEINLGIKEPPPDPKKIADANRLFEEARVILAKARVTDFDLEVALEKLNEAYDNNPNDKRITELKDQAQLLRGGSATILDSADQQQFRIAEQLFLDKKYYEALAIVERLLEKPQNKGYAPLNDLKRRIDSFI